MTLNFESYLFIRKMVEVKNPFFAVIKRGHSERITYIARRRSKIWVQTTRFIMVKQFCKRQMLLFNNDLNAKNLRAKHTMRFLFEELKSNYFSFNETPRFRYAIPHPNSAKPANLSLKKYLAPTKPGTKIPPYEEEVL